MGKVAWLWNPRGNHRMCRHWIAFDDQIIVGGERFDQAGALSMQPDHRGGLRVRLRVAALELEELVDAGNDIAVWINGLELFMSVKAVEDGRMLVAFGIRAGSKVNVILDAGAGAELRAEPVPRERDGAYANGYACPVGLRQTRPC